MRRQGHRRRLAVAVTAGSLMLTPLAVPASAVSSAHCTKLDAPAPLRVSGVPTRRSSVTGCTPLTATGGSGKSVTNLNTLVSKTTWAGGKGTTIVKVTYKAGPKPNKCPKGTHLTISGGTVIGGSGAALKVIKVGYTVSARWCVGANSAADSSRVRCTHSTPPRSHRPRRRRNDHINQWRHHHNLANLSAAATTTTTHDHPADPAYDYDDEPADHDHDSSERNRSTACRAVAGRPVRVPGWCRRRRDRGRESRSSTNRRPGAADGERKSRLGRTQALDRHGRDGYFVPHRLGHRDQRLPLPNRRTGIHRTERRVDDRAVQPQHDRGRLLRRSPPNDGHRLNILSTNFHNIGIGCIINNSSGAIFSTQDFGS